MKTLHIYIKTLSVFLGAFFRSGFFRAIPTSSIFSEISLIKNLSRVQKKSILNYLLISVLLLTRRSLTKLGFINQWEGSISLQLIIWPKLGQSQAFVQVNYLKYMLINVAGFVGFYVILNAFSPEDTLHWTRERIDTKSHVYLITWLLKTQCAWMWRTYLSNLSVSFWENEHLRVSQLYLTYLYFYSKL